MPEHISSEQIQGFNDGTLSASEILVVDDHLSGCESCRSQTSRRLDSNSLFHALKEEFRLKNAEVEHLEYEELVALVDETWGETNLDFALQHLKQCSQCETEFNDLRILKNSIAVQRENYSPPNMLNARQKVMQFWHAPTLTVPLRIAGIAALFVFFVWAAMLPLRRQSENLQTELQKLRQENERLKQRDRTSNKTVEDLKKQLVQAQGFSVNGEPLVQIADEGSKIVLDKQRNIQGLASLSPPYLQIVKEALLTERVKTPDSLQQLAGKASVLMGASNKNVPFALLAPVGTIVSSDQPSFRWKPLTGARTYTVGIYDLNFNEIEISSALKTTTWNPTHRLQRGVSYIWQVTADLNGQKVVSPIAPTPEAQFKIIEAVEFKKIEEARQMSNSHLFLGALYSQYGLLDEAEMEFAELLRLNPKSTLVQNLMKSVQSVRSDKKKIEN